MDTLTDECVSIDADSKMTILQDVEVTEGAPDIIDEVEDLRNSLRAAVHDEAVRPKMQFLMMDPSFSMVTVQGEDSGIQWETNPSRSSTPWPNESGNPRQEYSSVVMARPTTPGSGPAGRIIFVMDEEHILKRKKVKGRSSECKTLEKKQKGITLEDEDGVCGRPELVEISLPNIKVEGEAVEAKETDLLEEKEQRLFRLVSEGSEILNIVVSPKLVTVDEEESTTMVDNLSYLEESLMIKPAEVTTEEVLEPSDEVIITRRVHKGHASEEDIVSIFTRPPGLDPDRAPGARPQGTGEASNMDYFEKFTLVDAQAPGTPAVVPDVQEETQVDATGGEEQLGDQTEQPKSKTSVLPVVPETSEISEEEEMTSDLLDEVFYGGMDDVNSLLGEEKGEGKVDEASLPKSPLKKSGSALFGSQEDILTPIFLPSGPPKIINPVLFEEPKAMAFLYTDLYEEALGSRMTEEDAQSQTSEKSFHSRQSDREDRGYLEKFVLKDETPVVELEQPLDDKVGEDEITMWSQDLYNDPTEQGYGKVEEEVTDFFRSSANSSPCDTEPFPPSIQTEDDIKRTKKAKAQNNAQKATQSPLTSYTEKPGKPAEKDTIMLKKEPPVPNDMSFTEAVSKPPVSLEEPPDMAEEPEGEEEETQPSHHDNKKVSKLEAAPGKKAASSVRPSLDLTPLTPVDIAEEREEAGGKEQRVEEKEKASPAETADEGEGEGEETERGTPNDSVVPKDLLSLATEGQEVIKGEDADSVDREIALARSEGRDFDPLEVEKMETEPVLREGGVEKAHINVAESPVTEHEPLMGGGSVTESAEKGACIPSPTTVTETAKERGRCIIL